MTTDYRPARRGERFLLQIGERKQRVLMRVTAIDESGNWNATMCGLDEAMTAPADPPVFVWRPGKR